MSATSTPVYSAVSTPLTSAPASPILSAKKESTFLADIEARRSLYALSKELPFSTERLHEIVNSLAVHMPSSFNTQTTRTVVLSGDSQNTLWELVKDALRAKLSPEAFPATEARLNGFQAAYGTTLFFIDPTATKALQAKMPTFADSFPTWAIEAGAMHQFALWTALEAEGAGANLQHYGNLVEDAIKEKWNIPKHWNLTSQLVFGGRLAGAGDKTSKPAEEMVFWHE